MVAISNATSIYEQAGLSSASQADNGSAKELGQDAFLELMTTQMKNQDPFSPMDNTAFLGQMAQFGTVNGIQGLQDSFSEVSSVLQSNQTLQAASLIGRDVLVSSDRNSLQADVGMRGEIGAGSAAQNIKVNIYDAAGQLVQSVPVVNDGGGLLKYHWDGTTANGFAAPLGEYSVVAEGQQNGLTQSYPTFATARVNSVTVANNGGEIMLDLEGVGLLPLSQAKRIQ
ncbi:MAG: flagellar hook assembly protein FlgD [Gammaproteobacteria bacterium]|nr:flagellar hook assembly protein FlgD [Gammaproteobacteria bacterium]